MGTTNLLIGLKRKFAHLSGEARALDSRIQHLKAECAGLKELRARAASLRTGLGHVSAVIKMIEPSWDEASVAPIKPHSRRNPMKPGECISTAMDILRTADRWLTARELGKAVLHHFGLPNPDRELLRRVTNSIDAALRTRKDKTIVCDDSYPRRWRRDRGLGRPLVGARVNGPRQLPLLGSE
jgi:hypothetical protein